MHAGILIGILDAFVKRIEAVSSQILKFLVKWMLQTISYCQLKSHLFYVLTSQSIVSLVHGYAVLYNFILCPDVSVHSIFGPWLCSALQLYFMS